MYAYIRSSVVSTVKDFDSMYWPYGEVVECAPAVKEGWRYEFGELIPPPSLPPEQIRAEAKASRAAAVAGIKVTTQAGNTFDGDEISQTRMARAILVLQATSTPSTIWVLADNTVITATAAELTEALALAGAAQAALWVIP